MNITPSHIIEYNFCPRFTYFEYVLRIPQFEEKEFKVQKGKDIHLLKAKQNSAYFRKRIGVVKKWQNHYVSYDNLRGYIDECFLLEDGTMAPLDYKFAQYKEKLYDTYKTQLYCYALLIEKNFNRKVTKGFIVYTRSRNFLLEVPVLEKDKSKVQKSIDGIASIVEGLKYPKYGTKYKKRCSNCTYRNVCTR